MFGLEICKGNYEIWLYSGSVFFNEEGDPLKFHLQIGFGIHARWSLFFLKICKVTLRFQKPLKVDFLELKQMFLCRMGPVFLIRKMVKFENNLKGPL